MIETEIDEGWSLMKLRPSDTGLPMAIWINENDGYPHDVRVKVSKLHGGGGSWRHDSVSVAVRPRLRVVTGSLPTDDFALVRQWIELNRQTIIDHWNGIIPAIEIGQHLRRLS